MDSGSQIHAQKERAVITIVMYSIWTSRNILTRGELAFNPVKSMKFIRETLQTFEVDCTVLVQNWKNHDVDRSLIKPVSNEISKLSECLLSFSVLFSPVARQTRRPTVLQNLFAYMRSLFLGMLSQRIS
jgi:hypothetical protein